MKHVVLALSVALFAVPAQAERVIRAVNTVDGTRYYVAHIPAAAAQIGEVPAVIAYHPGSGTAIGWENTTGLHLQPGAAGMIVVYPKGIGGTWNVLDCCGTAQEQNVDDLAFTEAILADLDSISPSWDTSPDGNFTSGFSNGGAMAHYAACALPERFAAVATSGSSRQMAGCVAGPPVAVLTLHGLEDVSSPYHGGNSNLNGAYRPGAAYMVDFWAAYNGAVPAGTEMRLGSQVECDRSEGAADVIHCPIPDFGHWWPGDDGPRWLERTLGPDRPDLDGSAEVMAFFAAR